MIQDLGHTLEDPEELVRTYAAWALAKIGGSQAKQTLEVSLSRERALSVRQGIESALPAA